MKKRLLISSVLMSAVLACALGTGTYAWYQVSTGTVGSDVTASADVATSVYEYSVGTDQIVLGFGTPVAPTELSNGAGETYYVDGTYLYQNTAADNTTQIGSCALTVSWKGTDKEAQKSLAGQKVTAYVVASDNVQLLKDNTSVLTANEVDYIKVVATVSATGTLSLDVSKVYFAVRPTNFNATADESGLGGTLSYTTTQPAE